MDGLVHVLLTYGWFGTCPADVWMVCYSSSVGVQDIEQIAKEYVGRSVYVNWPHLEEARVLAVCDGSTK